MEHLSPEVLSALESGDARVRAHFAQHLAEECEVCERFLATHEGPGLLDGQVDRLLLALAPPREAALDEVGFARIRRGLRAAPRRRWGAAVGVGAALAASLLVVFATQRGATPYDTEQGITEQGIKGATGQLELELSVAARGADGALRRLDAGAEVAQEDVLLLRYHASEAGTALLFQQREGEAPELLGRFPLQPGTHDLAGEAGLAGVGLQGEVGPLRLLLVGMPAGQALDPDAVSAALAGVNDSTPELGLQAARFDVQVRNGENAR
jgi:hypothetical protein